MKTTLFLVSIFLTITCFSQDTLLGKKLYFNRIGNSSVHKLYTALDTVHFEPLIYWQINGDYKRYAWENNLNYLLISEKGDSAWIMKISLYRNFKNKIVFKEEEISALKKSNESDLLIRLLNGSFWIGMNEEQLKISIGLPTSIHETFTSSLIQKQYVYGEINSSYFYFSNGKLTTIQN